MALLAQWFARPRVKYQPLNSTQYPIEMAERIVVPTTAHEEGRDTTDPRGWSHDVAGGELGVDAVHRPVDTGLPQYKDRKDSVATLQNAKSDGNGKSDDKEDISEEDLATLRRVSDKIPISAWYV